MLIDNTTKVFSLIKETIEPVIEKMGLLLYDMEYKRECNGMVLRVFIDKTGGKVTIKDCQDVSHMLSLLLDEKNTIEGQYNLEVSSPGLDRVLKLEKDFIRFKGYEANVYFNDLVNGKNNFTGKIMGVECGNVILLSKKGIELRTPVTNVKKGKLLL